MNVPHRLPRWVLALPGLRGMFNLNDPRWGRGEEGGEQRPADSDDRPTPPPPPPPPRGRGPQGSGGGQPPDLDELWRDLNRKLSGLLGNKGGGGRGDGLRPDNTPPDMKSTGNWRIPYPVQSHELVFVTQIRSVDIGRDIVIKSTGLRESAMLTEDENIVEIKFAVQYRLSDARAWLFESKNPDIAVVQAAESAVREVVGKMRMDSALAEERDQIAPRVRELMQTILDRYAVGVEIVGINLQQGGVRPPEQVQAAFDDVLKAGQERERAKNEAEAYANDVIPRAKGTAARLAQEAEGYKARIVAQAEGDAQRFSYLLTEYKKAPQVTRERLYTEALEEVYSNVTKVLVDSRQGLLYLPLDKVMQNAGVNPRAAAEAASRAPAPSGNAAALEPNPPASSTRARDADRSRAR